MSFDSPLHWLRKFFAINAALSRTHEHVSPKYTKAERRKYNIRHEYGGITGTLRPSAMLRIVRALAFELPKEYCLNKEAVFCDVGCGTGRPVLYFACLDIRASIGFDIDPMQVCNSCKSFSRVKKTEHERKLSLLKCKNISFFQGDVTQVEALNPVTHVYSFLGYPQIVSATTLLVCKSESVQAFVAVVLHQRELEATGILDNMADVIVLTGLQMPSGCNYTAFVIPITPARRKAVIGKATYVQQKFQDISPTMERCSLIQPERRGTFARKLNYALEDKRSASEQLAGLGMKKYGAKRQRRVAAEVAIKRLRIGH